jgi:hypothetical protein
MDSRVTATVEVAPQVLGGVDFELAGHVVEVRLRMSDLV